MMFSIKKIYIVYVLYVPNGLNYLKDSNSNDYIEMTSNRWHDLNGLAKWQILDV